MRSRILLAACIVLLSIPAWAHDARPLSIQITEQQRNTYRVQVLMPSSIDASNQPEILFPDGCAVQSGNVRPTTDASIRSMLVSCPAASSGIDGQKIGIRYPIYNPSLATLFRYRPAEGATRSAVLSPVESEWVVPTRPNWKTVARDYLWLGIEHIWAGIDHLLFVAGLLLLAKTPRRILLAVTGFTIAHSVTLSLSTLGILRLPLRPIEAGIALSILFVAREIAMPNPESLARRFPLAISSFFGLLHGFGFAAALRDAGLPQNEIGAALLFFNAGVEVGQLTFLAIALVLAGAVLAGARKAGLGTAPQTRLRAEAVAAYGLGIPAALWFIERFSAFWA